MSNWFESHNIYPFKNIFSFNKKKKKEEPEFSLSPSLSGSAKTTSGNMVNTTNEGEPVSPVGRFFLQPQMQTVINCAIGFKFPTDIEALKQELPNSPLMKHPRFCSVLVQDKKGMEHWRRTQVDLDKHIILVSEELEVEDFVNDYIANLSFSSPLDPEKPLWEFHVLQVHKCIVVRFHHSLGDGISIMSLFLALCRTVENPDQLPTVPCAKTDKNNAPITSPSSFLKWALRLFLNLCFSLVYIIDLMLHIMWVRDKKTVISGDAGTELWPRKLVTASFSIDDMKVVKKAINGTINDVLLGIISCGFSRYFELRSEAIEGQRITGLAMVNTRQRPGLQDMSAMMMDDSKSRWGIRFGFVLLPTYLRKHADLLRYVRTAKAMMDQKKRSLEALLCYYNGVLATSILGPKLTTMIIYRILSNTTFTISNVVGLQEEITFFGNPVTYIRVSVTSLPHSITMHMVSYMGKADLQILVAKDIVPDPHVLANCFQEALLQMKEASIACKLSEAHLLAVV